MADALEIIGKAVVTALSANSSLVTLVGTKIYQGSAPPGTEDRFPYVLFSYASGGYLNDAPFDAVDIEFMITGVGTTASQSKAIATLISETLKHATLTYTESWHEWSTVRETDFFSRDIVIQNSEYKQVGAYYRFRISKGI